MQRATGKRVSRNKLAGLKYQKRSSQVRKSNVTMNVKIRKYRYPEVYEVHFAYDSGSNTIRYQVEPRGEDGLTLTYREKFVNPAPERGLFANFRLRRYEKRAERRADQTLKASFAKPRKIARTTMAKTRSWSSWRAKRTSPLAKHGCCNRGRGKWCSPASLSEYIRVNMQVCEYHSRAAQLTFPNGGARGRTLSASA